MCRWIGYSGSPIPLDELILNPEHSLIDQSMSARMAAHATNGDGFGLGWFGRQGRPGTYHSVQPAWNDGNLRDLCYHVQSGLFLAHIRRSTGTPVQSSNCHPFRHDNWLMVHNGLLRGYQQYRHSLLCEVAAQYMPDLKGSTDSELIFLLALSYGLDDEPLEAVARVVRLIESLAAKQGIENAVQMTLGFADGERLIAIRYSTEGKSRSLYYSESAADLRAQFPGHPRIEVFPDDARAVVSEPLNDAEVIWREVPESTAIIVEAGTVRSVPFRPHG